jgi:hypothetical protein
MASGNEPVAAFEAAMVFGVRLLRQSGCRELAVALPDKAYLSEMVARVLGSNIAKALDRDNTYVHRGLTLHLLTPRIQRRRLNGPLIAIGLDARQLETVLAPQGLTDVIFLPLSSSAAEDLADYLERYPHSKLLPAKSAPGRAGEDSLFEASQARSVAGPM